ncbi:MAG: glycerophosphodiester phosphodiesterase [Acidimicrobiaceae bacterium]|nr:glycerophosphodiester phosphodiesterase [Acidimicrobiaceae bacterium]
MTTRYAPLRGPAILFAHRGARTLERENTIAAFKRAVSLGATGLETDAWLTSDGEVVLDHDGYHRRFPRQWLKDTNRADLKAHICTLVEFYDSVGIHLPVSVDLKDPEAFAPIVEIAREYRTGQQLWICHPELDLLAQWRQGAPDVRLVHSTAMQRLPNGPERLAAELSSAGVDAVNLRQGEWTAGLVALFHRFEVLAFGWDAQHERQLASLIDMGIDAVYSDHVERMVAVAAAFD